MNFATYAGHRALTHLGPYTAMPPTRIQPTRMHPNYQTVEPEPIANLLNCGGRWIAKVVTKVLRNDNNKQHRWSKILEVRGMEEVAPGYKPIFKALFNHQGRHALKIMPGGVRHQCENEFVGETCWRATHLDRDKIVELTATPNWLFGKLANKAGETIQRVESLRGVECHRDWRAIFDRALPRLGIWTRRAWLEGYKSHGDMWGMLQALTQIKRAGGQRVAQLCLSDEGWEHTREGRVPPTLTEELVKVDLAAQLN